MIARAAVISLAALSACGPPSPEALQRICSDRARAAAGPTGNIGVGIGSGGVATDLEVTIGSDFITGRDPQAVYDACIAQQTRIGATFSAGVN